MAVDVRVVSLCIVLLVYTGPGLAADKPPKLENKEDADVKGAQVSCHTCVLRCSCIKHVGSS